MRISLVNRHLVRWLGSLGVLIFLASPGFSQTGLQGWIDSVSGWIESYSELARLADQNQDAKSEFKLDLALEEMDRQREEARIDCLANRLLAEEYQPYDFDIRETMWCKGTLALPTSTLCPAKTALAEQVHSKSGNFLESEPKSHACSQPLAKIFGAGWISTAQARVWAGFEARLQSDWEQALAYSRVATDSIQSVIAAIERQRIENGIAKLPSLRGIFGRSVLPNQVALTSDEYSKIAIKLWKELQAHADSNGILSHSPWYELKSKDLQPLYDLATAIPALFGTNHR